MSKGKVAVGQKLRIVRIQKQLTLKDISSKAGISEGFLSQVERGKSNASLATVNHIATALGITLSQLFDDNLESNIVRKNERPTLMYGILGRKSLITPGSFMNMEGFIGEFEKNGSTGDELYSHGDSEELLYILRGNFEVQLGDHFYMLSEGDCVSYRSSVGHRIVNKGDKNGEVLWVISPPSN